MVIFARILFQLLLLVSLCGVPVDGFSQKLPHSSALSVVTDFSDYEPGLERSGSLRAVVQNAKPGSTIVFERPGTIALLHPLEILTAGLTIDGSTAPVVIIGDSVRIKASNVSLKHLWIFAGDTVEGAFRSKGGERDALTVLGSENGTVTRNVTIDHCWIGLGVDENLSTFGRVENVRVRNSFIAYGLNRSIHPKDRERLDVPGHSKGVLIGVGANDVEFAGNVIAHNFDRNIEVRGGSENVRFIGNIVYNWGRGNTFYAGDKHGRSSGIFRDNFFIAGAESNASARIYKFANSETERGFEVENNIGVGAQAAVPQIRRAEMMSLLTNVGPHPALHDRLSQQVVRDVLNGTGHVIDYVDAPVNSEARRGLGFLPKLSALVEADTLNTYRYRPESVRAVP